MRWTLISAHAGYPRLLDSGADFIEIDVRRDPTGAIIDSHDEPRPGRKYATLDEVLDAVSARAIGLHLDMKEAGYESQVLGAVLERLRPERIIATPDCETSVMAIKRDFPDVKVSPVDFISLDQQQATPERLGRSTLPVWVWTVDDKRRMRHFLDEPKIAGLTTNRPDLALRLRRRRS